MPSRLVNHCRDARTLFAIGAMDSEAGFSDDR